MDAKGLHVKRGVGAGSRTELDHSKLEIYNWKVQKREVTSSGSTKVLFTYVSPQGKRFRSSKDAVQELRETRLYEHVLKHTVENNEEEEAENAVNKEIEFLSDEDEDEDYCPPRKQPHSENTASSEEECDKITVPEGLFVGQNTSVVKFANDFNKYFKCTSDNNTCKGKLVLTNFEKQGLGGAANFTFTCSGCWKESIDYKSSCLANDSRRQMVSLALCLSFLCSGNGYASYRKVLGRGLGLGIISEKPFLNVIDLAFPVIKEILDEVCGDVQHQMKQIPEATLGSWSRAVTTCDGCWLIRGYFSQNCTFIIKNYLTGGLIYYGHLSMRGADKICDEELWQGTAKAAEGHLAQVLWAKAKEEGLKVEVNWQDADSSSAEGFRYSFPSESESKVMLCGGHVGRAHGKKLKELQTKSFFTSQFIALHIKNFPEIKSVKCCCVGKKHRYVATRNNPTCGCISPAFIQGAKRNHYCALVHAGTDPEKYRQTMLALGKYHCRDIHEWEGGSCSFHPLVKCSCNKCDVDQFGFCEELKCAGKPYKSANILKCELHALAYEIECSARANKANEVIHPGLGKGHSNLPEATFNVLTKFRAKDTNLHQKHYHMSTNLGLLQSMMTWFHKHRGAQYHWLIDLYSRLGLPVLDGIQEMCRHDNEQRMKKLVRKQTEKNKETKSKTQN